MAMWKSHLRFFLDWGTWMSLKWFCCPSVSSKMMSMFHQALFHHILLMLHVSIQDPYGFYLKCLLSMAAWNIPHTRMVNCTWLHCLAIKTLLLSKLAPPHPRSWPQNDSQFWCWNTKKLLKKFSNNDRKTVKWLMEKNRLMPKNGFLKGRTFTVCTTATTDPIAASWFTGMMPRDEGWNENVNGL